MKHLKNSFGLVLLTVLTWFISTSFYSSNKFKYTFKTYFTETATIAKDTNGGREFWNSYFVTNPPQPPNIRFEVKRTFINPNINPWDNIYCENEIILISINDPTKTVTLHDVQDKYFPNNTPRDTLNGEYILKCIPKDKILKTFIDTFTFDSKTDKGRIISISLGNYNSIYYYKVTSEQELSDDEKKQINQSCANNMELNIGVCLSYAMMAFSDDWKFIYTKKCTIELTNKKIKSSNLKK